MTKRPTFDAGGREMSISTYDAANRKRLERDEDYAMSNTPKVRATLYLPQDVLDESRDAASYLAGHPAYLTLTKLAETALRAELERLKRIYNDGDEFPVRSAPLKGGRPLAA